MIHIVEINALSEGIDRDMIQYGFGHTPDNEFAFLSEIDDKDGTIYVMPHPSSLLREYFINPNIDNDGFIDKKAFGKTLKTQLEGRIFEYIITNNMKIMK